jgi:esterase
MQLNYKVIGEGFPIVILHGLFGMLDNWQSIGKKLADQGYMVYLLDQRDHGKSPFTSAFNYKILADDLAHFMHENWLYKAHIVGHSMGGKTAMQFCFDNEDMVAKLIIVDVWNKTYKGGHEIIFDAMRTIDIGTTESRDVIYNHLKNYALDEGTVQFLLKNISRKKESGYEWKMNLPLLESAYQNILSNVGEDNQVTNVDALFIRGANSAYIKDEDFADVKKQFVNASIITIPNAGHWVHADQPALLLNAILEFIKQ